MRNPFKRKPKDEPRSGSLDALLGRRAIIMASMVQSDYWRTHVKEAVCEGGNGSVPEMFARLADIYASAIESLPNAKVADPKDSAH